MTCHQLPPIPDAWLDRLSAPAAIAVLFGWCIGAMTFAGLVCGSLMWGTYYLGLDDMPPPEWLIEQMRESGYLDGATADGTSRDATTPATDESK